MKQEDKQLILKDLCARLPYGVKVRYMDLFNTPRNKTLDVCLLDRIINLARDVKPYLFPMLSMTDKQKIEYARLREDYANREFDVVFGEDVKFDIDVYKLPIDYQIIDWLYEHHFDVHGLIDKSLAIDATNLNIY